MTRLLLVTAVLFGISAHAKTEEPMTKEAQVSHEDIICAGDLSEIMQKRYDAYDRGLTGALDKTNPSDAAMRRFMNMCRNHLKGMADLERRLKSAGVVNPNPIILKAAQADDPSAIIKQNLPSISRADLAALKRSFAEIRAASSKTDLIQSASASTPAESSTAH